ncbi:MAG: hypothetical protein OXU72_13340, partial [Gammaproteobacteria bacterium]|nr:hypothetical protein [Gammaproteobacteria bacterium]
MRRRILARRRMPWAAIRAIEASSATNTTTAIPIMRASCRAKALPRRDGNVDGALVQKPQVAANGEQVDERGL